MKLRVSLNVEHTACNCISSSIVWNNLDYSHICCRISGSSGGEFCRVGFVTGHSEAWEKCLCSRGET